MQISFNGVPQNFGPAAVPANFNQAQGRPGGAGPSPGILGDRSFFSPESQGLEANMAGFLGALVEAFGGQMDPKQLRIQQLQQEIAGTERQIQGIDQQLAQAQGNEQAMAALTQQKQQLEQKLQQLLAELAQLTGQGEQQQGAQQAGSGGGEAGGGGAPEAGGAGGAPSEGGGGGAPEAGGGGGGAPEAGGQSEAPVQSGAGESSPEVGGAESHTPGPHAGESAAAGSAPSIGEPALPFNGQVVNPLPDQYMNTPHDFGEDRGTHTHNGEDFAAPSGTPIRAVADGEIIAIGNQGDARGNFVDIRHTDANGNEVITKSFHLSSFGTNAEGQPLKIGDEVGAGSTVGGVGSTGRSTGPHLHFEVHQNGKSVDPQEWLATNKTSESAAAASSSPTTSEPASVAHNATAHKTPVSKPAAKPASKPRAASSKTKK